MAGRGDEGDKEEQGPGKLKYLKIIKKYKF